MTQVRIPAIRDAEGEVIPGTVQIYLIDRDGRKRTAWMKDSGGLLQTCRQESLPIDIVVTLIPQDNIAIDDKGSPTYYRFDITARSCSEQWDAVVPDSQVVVDLMEILAILPE